MSLLTQVAVMKSAAVFTDMMQVTLKPTASQILPFTSILIQQFEFDTPVKNSYGTVIRLHPAVASARKNLHADLHRRFMVQLPHCKV